MCAAPHIGVALALELGPIALADFDVESIVVCVFEAQSHAGRIPHNLLRNAADVHARAAQAVRLDDGGFCAIFGCALRASQPAAAAADADEIECLLGHAPMIRVRKAVRIGL